MNAYIYGLILTSNPAHQTMSSFKKASFCLVIVAFGVLACWSSDLWLAPDGNLFSHSSLLCVC